VVRVYNRDAGPHEPGKKQSEESMNHKAVIVIVLVVIAAALLGACQNVTPQQAQAVVATYEALPAAQRTAVAEKAATALKSLSADQKASIKATMEAALALEVQAHNTGAPPPEVAAFAAAPAPVPQSEPVPAQAAPPKPQITTFFASAPAPAEASQGVAFFLNYDTVNATRVEIAGFVMDNPATGRWPVWGSSPQSVPDEWSIWAANDTDWTDAWMKVDFDSNLGSAFQPVTVNNRNVTLSLLDPQYVDGDTIELRVNGQSFGSFVMDGRAISFPLVLVGGQNTIQLICTSTGTTPNATVKATLTNVASGNATQLSSTLQQGQSDSWIITAP
jgi:hypothetical protein